jgi:membrane protease YdiL (CAAX protease family)
MPDAPHETPSLKPSDNKRCDYCGNEAALEALFCGGCGTPFPPRSEPAIGPTPEPQLGSGIRPARLGARSASIILLIYLAGQTAGVLFVSLVAGLNSRPTGAPAPTPQEVAAFVRQIMPFAVTFGMATGGAAMLIASVRVVRTELWDRSPVGAAWAVGSWRQIAGGCSAGVLIAFTFVGVSAIPLLRPTHFTPGPLARMASTPGLPQILWVVNALLLAPPIEELLFRGVAYGGYRRSFGPGIAAVLATVIFWLLHLTEMISNLPAALGVGTMALVSLWFRLRSSAVGPAVAAHLGYNALLVAVQLAVSHVRH